jgi:TATA-box binding protein (TBP) (component of TFIID and TFIIIB)
LKGVIANVTTTHSLYTPDGPLQLDLEKIANEHRDTFGFSHNPRLSMPAIKINIECKPYFKKINVAIYASGSVVQTGAPSPEQARLAAHMFARTSLRHLGICNAQVRDFKVRNIVATVQGQGPVDLMGLQRLLGQQRCDYKHPQDPLRQKSGYSAAIVKSSVDTKIKILIYDTAHCVMMGTKSRDAVSHVIQEIQWMIEETKKSIQALGFPVSKTVRMDSMLRLANQTIHQRLQDGRAPRSTKKK